MGYCPKDTTLCGSRSCKCRRYRDGKSSRRAGWIAVNRLCNSSKITLVVPLTPVESPIKKVEARVAGDEHGGGRPTTGSMEFQTQNSLRKSDRRRPPFAAAD